MTAAAVTQGIDMPSPMTLQANQIHLWYALPSRIDNATITRRCYPLLSAAERAQAERFQWAADRKTCLITRALVRTVLSKYVVLTPTAWQFEKNAYGRPLIARDCVTNPIYFSISHTRELVICAVASTDEIGVDTESLDRRDITLALAERYFAAAEVDTIKLLPERDRNRRLLEHWTLKEAYLKARGQGMYLPIDGVAFTFEPDALPSAAFDDRMGDTQTDWQFGHLAPINNHLIAYAVRTANPNPAHIEVINTAQFT